MRDEREQGLGAQLTAETNMEASSADQRCRDENHGEGKDGERIAIDIQMAHLAFYGVWESWRCTKRLI